MAHWITTNTEFRSFVSDRLGYKSGLALTSNEMCELLDKKDPLLGLFTSQNEEIVRISTGDIEVSFQTLLFRLGVTGREFVGHSPTLLDIEFRHDPNKRRTFQQVLKVLGEFHFYNGKKSIFDGFNEDHYFHLVRTTIGEGGLELARMLVERTREREDASPWDWLGAKVTEWDTPIELKELFESESLNAMYGTFLDQRYINYLAANTEKLTNINWRKFEALTAEYFERRGYVVQIGAGRNDGGVDVRIWNPKSNPTDPPVQLIQCKRTKSKIDKVLVKSLWADVVDEKAEGGVIVTTSTFSPGAREVCKARKYPIREANRKVVVQWLNELRKVGRGVFMGE